MNTLIDEILEQFASDYSEADIQDFPTSRQAVAEWSNIRKEAKSELLKAILEVIGEDEKFKNVYQWQQAEPLNLLRQELRTKYKALFGENKEEK